MEVDSLRHEVLESDRRAGYIAAVAVGTMSFGPNTSAVDSSPTDE